MVSARPLGDADADPSMAATRASTAFLSVIMDLPDFSAVERANADGNDLQGSTTLIMVAWHFPSLVGTMYHPPTIIFPRIDFIVGGHFGCVTEVNA